MVLNVEETERILGWLQICQGIIFLVVLGLVLFSAGVLDSTAGLEEDVNQLRMQVEGQKTLIVSQENRIRYMENHNQ